jgi:hypothetical protein
MSRPRQSGVLDAPLRFVLPLLVLLTVVALPACDGTTEPIEDLPFNELAIHAAVIQRLAVFNHSIEANANVGQAFDSGIRDFEPIPAELLGNTLIYSFDDLEWMVDEDAPARPDDAVRVTWYPLTGSSITSQEPRGYVDLTRLTDPTLERIHVAVVRTAASPAQLTNYSLRYGTSEADGVETRTFQADGTVSDGSRTVDLGLQEITSETQAGDLSATLDLSISDEGIDYTAVMDASRSETTEALNLVMTVVLDGATTRVELDVQEVTGQTSTGTGEVRHNGVKVADITISGVQMNFIRPSGGSFGSAQSTRLGQLVNALFNPLLMVEVYFR